MSHASSLVSKLKKDPKLKAAWDAVGGLSLPSKMPGFSYGLPAKECNVGSKLVSNEFSTCHSCYALKGRYLFPNVQKAEYRRLAAYKAAPYRWSDNMSVLTQWLVTQGERWFRWHDSGDLVDAYHLHKIKAIAWSTSAMRFWLPTREYKIVRMAGPVPRNLVIRVSLPIVGTPPELYFPWKDLDPQITTSGIHNSPASAYGHQCPARELYKNTCGPCRACWDATVPHVTYPKH